MAAALTRSAPCVVGPVPFKDVVVVADDGHRISPHDEYADIISAMPSVPMKGKPLHHYQGAWLVPQRIPGILSIQRRFAPRPGDVLLASQVKCGMTWLKALSFATMARAARPLSGGDHPLLRLNPNDCVPFMDDLFSAGQGDKLEALPSPRLMNTNMHHSMLPASVADDPDCKIVYLCREPKDMLVSLWQFTKNYVGFTFSDMMEWACEGHTPDGPIWDHMLGYWNASKASPEKVLFLRYEELLLDPAGGVRELGRFLGLPFSAGEEAAGLPADIVKLCSMETLKGLGVNRTAMAGLFFKFPRQSYFGKGVAGDWVNHMTPEMARRFDAIVEEKIRGSGLDFNTSKLSVDRAE